MTWRRVAVVMVNCLLGMEESGGGDGDSKGEEGETKRGSGEGKLTKNSVPGSPIVETATSSSFGSSNSSPSLANLAPIRTHVEGGVSVTRKVFDEMFERETTRLMFTSPNSDTHKFPLQCNDSCNSPVQCSQSYLSRWKRKKALAYGL